MNRLINIGASIGVGLGTYVLHKRYLEYIESVQKLLLIKSFHDTSMKIALHNNQIKKMFGPGITTTVSDEVFERFKPECKSFSVNIF
jgi:hypothetical protein